MSSTYASIRTENPKMEDLKDFHFYIPTDRRKKWAEFRERVDNEGKRLCDVLMDLVDGYLEGEK